jgi:hypothetical protein
MHLYASDILSMPDKYVVATARRTAGMNDFVDGSILTLQHGTPPSTVSHLQLLTLHLPRSSLICSPVNGT